MKTPGKEAPAGVDEAAQALSALLGQSTPLSALQIHGETITVSEFRIAQLPDVIRTTSDIIGSVRSMSTEDALGWLRLFEDHTADLVQLMALATGKPAAWVSDLSLSEAADVLERVIRVNARFFFQRLGPLLGRLSPGANPAPATSPAPGPTDSPP
jgi:hypothetical protein